MENDFSKYEADKQLDLYEEELRELLEIRRALVMDFEEQLGAFYDLAKAGSNDHDSVTAVLQILNSEYWQICRDEVAGAGEMGSNHYWLNRLKTKGSEGELRKSKTILPNQDVGYIGVYSYSQSNANLSERVDPLNPRVTFIDTKDAKQEIFLTPERLALMNVWVKESILIDEPKSTQLFNRHKKIIFNKT